MNKKYLNVTVLSLLLIGFDLISKTLLYNKNYLSNLSFIKPVLNTGISWSIQIDFTLIIVISILATAFFICLYIKKQIGLITFVFLLSGTLGNLIDRVLLGGVRDFISIGNFPIFNFADIFLNVGIISFIINEFLMLKKNKKNLNSD